MTIMIEWPEPTTKDSSVASLDALPRVHTNFAIAEEPYEETNRGNVSTRFSTVPVPWTTDRTIRWAMLRYDDLLRKLAD